jgi:L-ascorbate metabolism protein UlaG (beta-lactamase superfamily)
VDPKDKLRKKATVLNGKENAVPYTVCWIGNAGWRLSIGGLNLLIDPDLEPSAERKSLEGIPEDCLTSADLVMTTHDHGDHFNDWTIKALSERSSCRFLLAASCLSRANALGIPAERLSVAYHENAFEPFGEHIRITPKPAFHGAPHGAVFKHATRSDSGYLIEAHGVTLFHPGDTVLLEDHYELPRVDVLMISPTDHNTDVRQSIQLIEQLDPAFIFPQHRDTYVETSENYYWTHAHHRELLAQLSDRYAARYHILAQGEVFKIQ